MSTQLSAGRVVRPFILFLSGVLAASLLTANVAAAPSSSSSAAQAVSLRSRIAACSGLAFHTIDGATQFGHRTGQIFSLYASTGDNLFVCDPALPNKAVVTKVGFSIRDDQDEARVEDCALVRVPLAPAAAETLQVLASIRATGIADVPNNLRVSTTSISYSNVDLSRFTYFLQCRLGNGTGLFGATVNYTISSTNG